MQTPVAIDAAGWRYRFDGVELDLAAQRLRIDGEERPCSRRAMQLLTLLCERPGVLLSRDAVIDMLWPGGQVVSDEALTQIVFRTRAVLGPYAERLATVRGAGLRLDARVVREAVVHAPQLVVAPDAATGPLMADAMRGADGVSPASASRDALHADPLHTDGSDPAAPRAASPLEPSHRAAVARPASRSARRFALACLLLVLAAIAFWQLQLHTGTPAPIDIGYGLDAADAHAESPGTAALLRDAFAQEAGGDRERAVALLEAVHGGDAGTPIPALFLALWALGGGDVATSDAWLAQARARLAPLRSPSLLALLHYVEAERAQDARAVVRHAGAVLDQRPRAWQMRTARAHLLLGMRLPDAARAELEAIDVTAFDHRKLAMAVADRAALGDVAGAQAVFDRLQDTLDAPEREFLRARIAWSRGDLAAARDGFASAIAAGERSARFALMKRALIHLGVLELQLGRGPQAIAALDRARASAQASRAMTDWFDSNLLLAQLHADAGDRQAMQERLREAMTASRRDDGSLDGYVAVFVARLAPDLLPADLALPEPAAALLAARRAFDAGDRATAGAALDRALAKGALETPLSEETRLLQALLGRAVAAPASLDPPFPPASRHATRHVLGREMSVTHGAGI